MSSEFESPEGQGKASKDRPEKEPPAPAYVSPAVSMHEYAKVRCVECHVNPDDYAGHSLRSRLYRSIRSRSKRTASRSFRYRRVIP